MGQVGAAAMQMQMGTRLRHVHVPAPALCRESAAITAWIDGYRIGSSARSGMVDCAVFASHIGGLPRFLLLAHADLEATV